ncbi:MAG: hypothetical protein KOO61_09780 [Spirochaetales bacterium]|nr:hypothetical protein [Spirochaetales bacterium]
MTFALVGLLLGLINTTTLHIAKAMQRHGINTLRWARLSAEERSGKHAAIYIVGVILNQTTPLWIILANRYSAPAYATGMFGVGLVLLLVYSSVVLKEPVSPVNYLGAIIVMGGTILFSVHSIQMGSLDVSLMDRRTVFLFSVAYMAASSLGLMVGFRSRKGRIIGIAFGMFAGAAAGLDPILKALGQNASGSASLIPTELWGWLPFGLSFVLGSCGFFTVQIAFLRGARASVFVPFQSSLYVLLPVVVQLLALPGYAATPILVTGIACIVAGIIFMQLGRNPAASVVEEAAAT